MLTALALATLTFTSAKPSTADIVKRSWNQTLVVGHRGAAAYKPENTLPSFAEAIASGAVATECDVHLSLDREVVIMHDKTLDRTTSLTGPVASTAFAAMKAAGVPTLADLTGLTKGKIVVVVEIKDGEGIEQLVVDHLQKEEMVAESIVFGFSSERMGRVKTANPAQFAVWLCASPADHAFVFDTLKKVKADGLGVQFKNATPELARAARERGIPLFVWTVPPGPEVDRLKDLRVNFIITDHPRDVVAQLGKK